MPADKVTVVRGDYQLSPPQAHQDVAAGWPVYVNEIVTEGPVMLADAMGPRETPGPVFQLHARCAVDNQSVLCLSPDTTGEAYQVTSEQLRAGVLAHIRQCHEDALTG